MRAPPDNSSLPLRWIITEAGQCGLILFLAWGFGGVCRDASFDEAGLCRVRVLRTSCFAIDGANLDPAIRKVVADVSSSRSVVLYPITPAVTVS